MKLDILSIDDFIEINKCQEVTSPFILASDGNPDPEGIFSYEIFGRVGSEDRSTNFGYINLKRKFLHPFIYNAIMQMYRALPEVISGERFVKLDKFGKIQKVNMEDEGAETGIDFFINNWKNIQWDDGESKARAKKQSIFNLLKVEEVFVDKWLVIPAMYRDINLHKQNTGKIDMDEINGLYTRLLNYAASESITFTSSFLTQSNLQNTLVEIHNVLTKKPAGKNGLIHNGIMGKTIDYASVSVISAPRFMAERPGEQQVPFNHIGVPLSLVCSLFFPFMVKGLEDRFFDVMHSSQIILGGKNVDVDDKVVENLDTEALTKLVKDYVKDKTKEGRTRRFSLDGAGKGLFTSFEEKLGRPYTVTDLLYSVAADVVSNRNVLATRFPISSSDSIIICKVKILTTEKTVDLRDKFKGEDNEGSYNFEFMRTYPYFPLDKDGNIMSSKTKWIDTTVPNNSYLAGLGGDFDGDTMRLIGIYTNDANAEAARLQANPMNYVGAEGQYTRGIGREAGLALYMLTKD